MPVAPNLIRVARPIAASDFTVVAYYATNEGVNGRAYAYEYDADVNIVGGPFQIDLPTTGDFTDFVFGPSVMARLGDLVYDGQPGLILIERTLGGAWLWRPRTGTLHSRVWYNTGAFECPPILIGGSFYVIRQSGGISSLVRLDDGLSTIETVFTGGPTLGNASAVENAVATSLSLTVRDFTSTWHSFALDGSGVSVVTMPSIDRIGIPHSALSLSPLSSSPRFPRVVTPGSGSVSFLWPNSSPWVRESASNPVRVQSADGHFLAFETGRAILDVGDADGSGSPILDINLPQQNGVSAFLAGIGNLP